MAPGDRPPTGPGSTPARALPPTPSPELIQEFLRQQGAQIAIRQEELEIQKQELKNTHEYAQKSLDAQLEDRKDTRAERRSARRDLFLFTGIIIFFLLVLMGYSVYRGSEDLAKEILKDVVLIVGGGMGGYSVGRRRKDIIREDSEQQT
ncbi:MAG: hypothetical protein ACREMU_15040 [Gemmatimonadaceae bacterium]